MFVEVCLLKYENRMKNIYWNAAKGYPRIQVQNRAEKNYKNVLIIELTKNYNMAMYL